MRAGGSVDSYRIKPGDSTHVEAQCAIEFSGVGDAGTIGRHGKLAHAMIFWQPEREPDWRRRQCRVGACDPPRQDGSQQGRHEHWEEHAIHAIHVAHDTTVIISAL